eukprot:GFYU01002548.1.p1 GENE.GFYU01002548.1~~GFYU01002548.1.p1  ORF type:complete len:356 (+),score=71.42 GFYU01002548.1:128-1195(+)
MRIIAGDIGATNGRLKLFSLSSEGDRSVVLFEKTYHTPDWPELSDMLQKFVAECTEAKGIEVSDIRACCVAVCGVVKPDGTCFLAGLNWYPSEKKIAEDLGIPNVKLLNDFLAVGYGIPLVTEEELIKIHDKPPVKERPIVAIGAGTGLGSVFATWVSMPTVTSQSGMLSPRARSEGYYQAWSSEGGMGRFTARSQEQWELSCYLEDKYGFVEVERVVSGKGLVNIYSFYRDIKKMNANAEVEAEILKFGDEAGHIVTGSYDKCEICKAAVEMFLYCYGAETGALTLRYLPGSVYIAGGIAAKIPKLMKNGTFMEGYLSQGQLRDVADGLPVAVITNDEVGILGAVALGKRLYCM